MSRARFTRLDPQRREQILDAAAARFAELGYAEASYNQILEDAGLSKSSAYYLFEGKADLYAAVVQRELDALVAAVPPPPPPRDAPSFWGATRGWLAGLIAYLARRPRSAALVSHYAEASARGGVPGLDPAIEATLGAPLSALLGAGQALGAVRTDVEPGLLTAVASGVLAPLDRHFLPLLTARPDERAVEEALDLYVDTLRRLLAP